MTKPSVLVFYTHHRPHLAQRDMEFFAKARKQGWVCEEIVTEKFPVRFPWRYRGVWLDGWLVAYVSGGSWRRGSAVYGSWVEVKEGRVVLYRRFSPNEVPTWTWLK